MIEGQVFISYARADQALLERLRAELERRGIDVWTDEYLRAGESFNEGIASALYQSRALVLISSRRSLASDYVNAEVQFAVRLGKQIFEVSVAGATHPDLTDIQRVQLGDGNDWATIVGKLAPSLKRALGPSEVFIAHDFGENHAQAEFLTWAADELEGQGIEVWLEAHRIGFGDDREEMTLDAIDRAGVMLAVLSTDSAASHRFSTHVLRALDQEDQVLLIVYDPPGGSREELVKKWRETFATVATGEERLMTEFERVCRLEPAVFIGGTQDGQLMAQVAKGLRREQAKFNPDEKVEREAARVFEEFSKTMLEMGLDAVEVLSLPKFKASNLANLSQYDEQVTEAVGQTGPSLQAVTTTAIDDTNNTDIAPDDQEVDNVLFLPSQEALPANGASDSEVAETKEMVGAQLPDAAPELGMTEQNAILNEEVAPVAGSIPTPTTLESTTGSKTGLWIGLAVAAVAVGLLAGGVLLTGGNADGNSTSSSTSAPLAPSVTIGSTTSATAATKSTTTTSVLEAESTSSTNAAPGTTRRRVTSSTSSRVITTTTEPITTTSELITTTSELITTTSELITTTSELITTTSDPGSSVSTVSTSTPSTVQSTTVSGTEPSSPGGT